VTVIVQTEMMIPIKSGVMSNGGKISNMYSITISNVQYVSIYM